MPVLFPHLRIYLARFVAPALYLVLFCSLAGSLQLAAQSPSYPRFEPRPLASGSSSPGTANFLGNFNVFSAQLPAEFVLQRQADCSLNLINATTPGTGSTVSFVLAGSQMHYEQTLHTLASLTTTPDVYPKGCAEKSTGISSRVGVYVGSPQSGLYVTALIVPNASGTTSLRTRVYSVTGMSATQTIQSSIPNAGGVATSDLNGDGIGDLVVIDFSGNVWVMLGNSDGSFKTPVPYAITGYGSVAAVIDDFNGDGKLDLAVVSEDQQISILTGNGDGTFNAAQGFAATLSGGASVTYPIGALVTADLRGIGRHDILCSNGIVLLSNGNGTFTQVTSTAFPLMQSSTSGQPLGLATGDLNNDGKVDLVVTTGLTLSIFLGNGDGTFTQGMSYASIDNTGYVTVTDLDGDGNLDIYTGQANGGLYSGDAREPGSAYAMLGNGNGTFQGAVELNTGAYTGMNLGDVNGDGIPDLITNTQGVYGTVVAAFTVQLGTPHASFTTASTFTAPANFTVNGFTFSNGNTATATTFAVADINSDHRADVVFVDNNLTAKNPGGSLITYPYPLYFTAISNGDGSFAAPKANAFPQIAAASGFDNTLTATHLQLADVNKDGKADLVFSYNETAGGTGVQPYNQGIGVLLGNGDGTFSANPILTSSYSGSAAPNSSFYPYVVSVVDINNDGKPDLLAINPQFSVATGATTTAVVYLGNADGTFQAPKTFALSANVYGQPVLADINKDGKLDLITLAETSAAQAELVIALGNGDGTFGTPTVLNVAGGDAIRSGSIAVADYNSDGNLDIALLDGSGISGVYYGDGSGGFQSVTSGGTALPQDLVQVFPGQGQFAIGMDLNGDGKADILAGPTIFLSIYGSAVVLPTATTTSVSASASTITVGTGVTFTATVSPHTGSPSPTGTVTFMDGLTTLGTGTVTAGVATYSTSALALGNRSITAVYGGDANFSASTSPAITVTVNAATVSTTTALSASATTAAPGTSITFTATVTHGSGSTVPTGTVAFSDGATTLGTGTLNASGVATYTTSSLAVGAHTIVAAYGGATGTTIFSGSASAGVTVTITAPPSYTIGLSATTTTVVHDSSATTTVTLTPSGGFTGSATVTCTGAPANSQCIASPSTIIASGAGAATCAVTLQTSITAAGLRSGASNVLYAGLLAFGLLVVRRRTVKARLCAGILAVAALATLGAAMGCGGKSGSSNQTMTTAPGTYNLTITATSGTIVQSIPWTVVVQ